MRDQKKLFDEIDEAENSVRLTYTFEAFYLHVQNTKKTVKKVLKNIS